MPAWIAAGGAIIGGLMGSRGSSKAAAAQQAAAAAAAAEEKRQFDITRGDFAPYREVGKEGLTTLARLMGLPSGATGGMSLTAPTREQFTTTTPGTPGSFRTGPDSQTFITKGTPGRTSFNESGYNNALASYEAAKAAGANAMADPSFGSLMRDYEYEADPGAEFRRTEGEKLIDRRSSAMGNRFSPATQKALLRFNSDLASQEYNTGFGRDMATRQNKFNMLSGIAGTGQTASSTTAQLGAQSAGNVGNYLTQAGNASAAGSVGQANAMVGSMNNGLNMWNQQRMLDQYLGGQQTGNVAGDAYQPARQYYGGGYGRR